MPEMMKNGYTEEYFQQVRNFVHATLEHYGTRIDSWMHSGEINLGRSLSPYYEDRYLRILQIVHSEVKACNPDIQVISLGVAGVGYPEYAYLKSVLPKALPYLDVVGPDWYITPYVYGPGYRPVSEEKGGLREQILDVQKLVQGKRLSIEEKGYGYAPGMPFDHQALKDNAAVAQRGMIIAKAHGIMHWVPHNGVAKKEGGSYNMGMWMNNNPRPILASTAAIARLLAHAKDAVEWHPSPEIWGYVFKKDGKSVAAIWQSSSKPLVETSLELPKDAVCYDIMGNACSFEGQLSNYPIFVESSERQDAFVERLNKSDCQMPKYAVEYQFASDSEIRLIFRNLSGKELKMNVTSPDVDSREFTMPVGDGKTLHTESFKLKKAVATDYRSSFTILNNGEKRSLPVVLNALPVTKLKDVKLDGTLLSFAAVKPIVMDNSSYLLPVDAAPNGLWTGKKDLSAKVYLGHDEKKFYIGVEVTDDQWFFTQTGGMLWNQDAIEISIDPLNNALSDEMKTRGYDSDDFDFSFGQSSEGPAAWCHLNPLKIKCGARPELKPVIGKKDENTMIVEFAISWEELGITPENGRVFGFNLGVFDREAATGGTSYNMSLSSGTTNGKDPSCYKKFMIRK